jgi:hypothetical protein
MRPLATKRTRREQQIIRDQKFLAFSSVRQLGGGPLQVLGYGPLESLVARWFPGVAHRSTPRKL